MKTSGCTRVVILRNVRNYSPNDTASHVRRCDFTTCWLLRTPGSEAPRRLFHIRQFWVKTADRENVISRVSAFSLRSSRQIPKGLKLVTTRSIMTSNRHTGCSTACFVRKPSADSPHQSINNTGNLRVT